MALRAQILAVTAANIRSIPQRLGNSLVIVVGVAGVVAVLILVLTMFVDFRTTIQGDGQPDRAIILPRAQLRSTKAAFQGRR